MKKLVILSLTFFIGTEISFAMSPLNPLHPLSPTQTLLRSLPATANSNYGANQTRGRQKGALENCLKNNGGKACYVKYKKWL